MTNQNSIGILGKDPSSLHKSIRMAPSKSKEVQSIRPSTFDLLNPSLSKIPKRADNNLNNDPFERQGSRHTPFRHDINPELVVMGVNAIRLRYILYEG